MKGISNVYFFFKLVTMVALGKNTQTPENKKSNFSLVLYFYRKDTQQLVWPSVLSSFVNWPQAVITWDEGTSIEKFPPSNQPVGMPVRPGNVGGVWIGSPSL